MNSFTAAGFADEDAAKAELDARLDRYYPTAFKVYKEVEGETIQPRLDSARADHDDDKPKGLRIDRILIPTSVASATGWTFGAIGIECKTSGKRLGRVVCQCLDYQRGAFRLEPHGVRVLLGWTFIWPLDEVAGDIESVMTQHRIGSLGKSYSDHLSFKCGSMNCISVDSMGRLVIRAPVAGGKSGSR